MTHDPVLAGLADPSGRVLENLLRDAVNGMAVLGLDGRFRAVNPALCRILGRQEKELCGLRPADITHPDDRHMSESTMQRLLAGEVSTDQLQKRYIRGDGRPVTVLRTTTVLRNADGQPVGLFTQVTDMSDVEEAQQSVLRSESRLKALLAHASELTLILDRGGRISFASPAAEKLLGYAAASLEGRSAFEFVHPDDRARAVDTFKLHLSQPNYPDSVHYRILGSDGRSWRHAEVLVTNLLDDAHVGGVVLNVRDVTEETLFRDRLAASERKFRALAGNSWDIITIHDLDGRYRYCSPAAKTQLGYTPDELTGTDPKDLFHPDDREAAAELWAATDDPRSVQYRFRHKDGSWRWLESTAQNRLDDPAIGGIVVTTRDITHRRRRLAQQDAVASLSSGALRGGSIEALKADAVRLVAEMLGAEHCEIVRDTGEALRTVARHGPDVPPVGETVGDTVGEMVSEAAHVTRRSLRERGTFVWNDGAIPPGPGPVRSAAAAVIVPGKGPVEALSVRSASATAFSAGDVPFLEAVANVLAAAITRDGIEKELREQALHDTLTGLPNRLLLQDRLERAIARLSRNDHDVTVLFVDLDNFKLVNDSLGHPAGDRLVSIVAERISKVIRRSDTVARFGGDEFVVLCEETDSASAADLAERIRETVSTPIELEGRTVTITSSIGMVTTSDRATSADELLSMADTAMYASKDAGKDCATSFAAHMRTAATERLEALSGIRRALADDEFRLVYQPIVSLETLSGEDFEALVRWQHPVEGLLPPAQFIGHAEACGLIIPLGEWVIRTAFAQSAAWRASGRPARVSVNISGLQLTQSDIVATVARAIEDSGASPHDLSLEVTEHAVMSDLHKATTAMTDLRRLGVQICMDDFGTGHSSLSHLADLPFDYVKIDRSFIQHFDRDRRAAALLESIATLCRTLDLTSVAEGVETERQLHHLRELGIRYAQGFLFGRPVPAEEAQEALASGWSSGRRLSIAG